MLTIYTNHPVENIVNKTGRGGRMTRYKVNPNQLDGLKRVENYIASNHSQYCLVSEASIPNGIVRTFRFSNVANVPNALVLVRQTV